MIGLGVMGANLARNIESRGFPVAVHDADRDRTRAFLDCAAPGRSFGGFEDLTDLVAALERPHRVLILVPAGREVDRVIAGLRPQLAEGDIVIDGGNSFFRDTDRRCEELAASGVRFLGTGISGGEAGALLGPAIMPGGSAEAWETMAPLFRAIAARADDGEPCVAYMGPRGAGHYVKMVHNGIEYGDMQLIAETYDLLSRGAGLPAPELAAIFAEWNEGELKSYLIEITARVLRYVDADTDQPLVDLILDEAEQKGTGKWMSQNAFDVGAPVPTITAAVDARILSSLRRERLAAGRVLPGPAPRASGGRAELIDAARQALFASKIASYAQGTALLRIASAEYGYGIDPERVAATWRAGCIIRAAFLNDIRDAFRRNPGLENLMLDEVFRDAIGERQAAWRATVQAAVGLGIPMPATSASLAYYDGYRSARLPANLTQAQRDFFGAHTYRRVDRAGVHHTDWAGGTAELA
jgi:6-phosphogluconate dehydrogenase